MPTTEETLNILEQEIRKLREKSEVTPHDPTHYDAARSEGFTAGWLACQQELRSRIREVLNDIATHPHPKSTTSPTSPPPGKAVTQPSKNLDDAPTDPLSAPEKDQLVREYLAANPGARYADIKRVMGQYPANRAYALRDKGEAIQEGYPEKKGGPFYLTDKGKAKLKHGAQNERPN